MSTEQEKYIHDYCKQVVARRPEMSPIDVATEGQIAFAKALLPSREGDPIIEIQETEDGVFYSRDRNYMGANVDLHNTRMAIKREELGKPVITPSAVEMQSRAVLRTEDGRDFAGYTESEYLYWRGGFDDRLQQSVKAVHMPHSVSPVFETVSIDRYVLDRIGDCSYGHIIFNGHEITDRLGVKARRGDPVFLAFTPEQVLATTYGSIVLKEISYDELKQAGLTASFHDEPEVATLSLATGQMSIQLRLGKMLKPNYPELMFSEKEEWITDSGILVGKVPQEALN